LGVVPFSDNAEFEFEFFKGVEDGVPLPPEEGLDEDVLDGVRGTVEVEVRGEAVVAAGATGATWEDIVWVVFCFVLFVGREAMYR
jgi:hypothetical protein